MEKRRTWRSFTVATLTGVVLSVGLMLLGQQLLLAWWPGLSPDGHPLPYGFLAVEALLIGAVMTAVTGYYPALEGFLASLGMLAALLVQHGLTRGWSWSMDEFISAVLLFESHFAALYLSAFIVFMTRGGGLRYPMFIGLRYLRFKMITGISVVGVAIGVAALMVVLSVMSGFEMDLKGKIVGTNAHAIVQKKGLDFDDYRKVEEKIRQVPGVIAATPFIYNEIMVTSEYNIAGVFIRGIDPVSARSVTDIRIDEGSLDLLSHPKRIDKFLEERLRLSLPKALGPASKTAPASGKTADDTGPQAVPAAQVSPGEGGQPLGSGQEEILEAVAARSDTDEVPDPAPLFGKGPRKPKVIPGILIGKELKKILKVGVGERINVISPLSEELGPSGPVPKARVFRVAGVFYTGMYEYDAKSVYVTLKSAQSFFELGDSVTGIALKFQDIDRAGPICEEILERLDGFPYFTRTWYEMNKNLFSALKMEKIGMFIVLVIVILVSAFGIISTLIMLVWEKVKEIAILKSMGATGDGVMKIFMVEGITIGLVGTGLGLLVGWLACIWLQTYGMQLDPEVYYIEKLPVNTDAVEFLLIAGIALHISFIATIYPSRRASRLRPVEGLRYD